jgi:hypothetical protein
MESKNEAGMGVAKGLQPLEHRLDIAEIAQDTRQQDVVKLAMVGGEVGRVKLFGIEAIKGEVRVALAGQVHHGWGKVDANAHLGGYSFQ